MFVVLSVCLFVYLFRKLTSIQLSDGSQVCSLLCKSERSGMKHKAEYFDNISVHRLDLKS